MFKSLKRKIIFVSASAIFIFLLVVVFTINFLNYRTVIKEADTLLEVLSSNKGKFPNDKDHPNIKEPNHMSPETPYESRYFSVIVDSTNEIISYDITQIASINYAKTTEYTNIALSSNKSPNFINNFRYNIIDDINGEKHIIFLDCSRSLEFFKNFLFISIIISLCSFIIVIATLIILSNKIIKPFAANYEKQKTFITDASHELKTPLTIINTNIDILEMEYGNNESFSDIHNQINHLKDLTNNLVFLTKMEETEISTNLIDFPLSDVISETIYAFKNLAISQGMNIIDDIEPLLTLTGNEKSIRQLTSILLENALKYSKKDTDIEVSLSKHNHSIIFCVTNESLYKLDKNKIKNVFDRFYRLDSSRNSSTGGHGIGLSIAKAIANNHNAKINAFVKDDIKFQIIVSFNAKTNN